MEQKNYILQWNLNGIRARLRTGELQRIINDYHPICICLQHIGDYDVNLQNYKLMSQSIRNTTELGTAIYVRNDILCENIVVQNSEFQYSATQICADKNFKFIVCNAYNQPIFNYNFQRLKEILENLPKPILLVGDFNAHNPMWDEMCTNPDVPGRKLEEIMEEMNLICMNEESQHTYVSHTNGAVSSIDIAACSIELADKLEWSVIEDRYTSDHHPTLVTCLQGERPERPIRYNTEKADWTKYKEITSEIQEYKDELTIEESYKIFIDQIIKAADESIPMTQPHRRKKEVPWWTAELQNLVTEKHKTSNKLIRLKKQLDKLTKSGEITQEKMGKIMHKTIEIKNTRINLNRMSAVFKRAVRKEKETSWKKYVSSINSRTPLKKLWKRFRKVNGAQTYAPKHALRINGQMIHDAKEICDAIGGKLEETSSDEFYEPEFRRLKANVERQDNIKFDPKDGAEEEYNQEFHPYELQHALKNTKKTSPGKDKITFEMMQNLPEKAMTYLLQMYNQMWTNGTLPEEWGHAVVIPIPKPGKDPSNPTNYRPISLTSCVCKTMEKMVNTRLTWILKEKSVITPTQCGAEKGRSTLDSLTQLEEHIRRGFTEKKPTVAIFFDVQKAYDTTWKHLILKKIKEVNIKGKLPTFIQNFMNNRTFQIRMDNTYSEILTQQNGIPQGSVISCTLYKIAINEIVNELPEQVKNSLFMDDYGIYVTTKSLRHAERILNLVLKKLEVWAKKSGVKFAVDKTRAVIFYRDKRWLKNHELKLKLNNEEIPVVENHKFLGIIFDSHLNFKQHIQYTKSKCKKALNLLAKLSHTTWGSDRGTLRTIYKATVMSILDYGSQIYSSATKSALRILDPVHNQGLRIMTGAFRSSPAMSLCVEAGEPPLQLHREKTQMKSAVKLMNSDSPTKRLFNKFDNFWKADGTEATAPFPMRAKRLLAEHEIDVNDKQIPMSTPPWTKKRPTICTALLSIEKNNNNPLVCRQKALQHMNTKGRNYGIFTDGSKNRDGVGSAAVATTEVRKKSITKEASIYTAELIAIYEALTIIQQTNFPKYVIYSDSKSALIGISEYTPDNPIVIEIQEKIHRLMSIRNIHIQLCWIPAHVGIQGNEYADQAAKEAAARPPEIISIPARDYYPIIQESIMKKWQRQWDREEDTNKLKSIKKEVKEWKTSHNKERKIEVTLTRLRIGHTNLTHSHLMTNPPGDAPECDRCRAPLTVKHVLDTCPALQQTRRTFFGNKGIKEILQESDNFSSNKLIQFLKTINVINNI